MPEHIVRSFDAELENLTRQVSEMGGVAEKMFGDVTAALVRGDMELAQSVIAADRRLDALQREVEEQAILMLVRRQPMAIDLRETVAAIRISGDLERIGDLSKNVGKRVLAMTGHMHPQRIVASVEHMSELCQEQLKDVLDAYVRKDAEAAVDVWKRDESPNGKERWQEVTPPNSSGLSHQIQFGPEHFVAVLEGAEAPILTAEHAKHVLEIILAAGVSMEEGCAVEVSGLDG